MKIYSSVVQGMFTGKFLINNLYFQEKVAMLLEIVLASVFGVAVFYAHIFIKKITNDE